MSQSNGRLTSFQQDSILAIEYSHIADISYMDVDKCLLYNQKALPLLKKTNQWDRYIYSLASLSYCYREKEDFINMEKNNVLALKEAKTYLSPKHKLYTSAVNNLGYLYANIKEDFPLAISQYNEALQLAKKNNQDSNVQGTLLKNIGDLHVKNGDFDNALSYFNEALNHFEVITKRDINKINNIFYKTAETYQSIARVNQNLGNLSTANENLNKMLHLMQQSKQPFAERYYLYCYTQMAEIALNQNNSLSANNHLSKAEQLKNLTNQQQAEIKKLYALLFQKENNLHAANNSINQAIRLSPFDKPVSMSKLLNIKGDIFLAQSRYKETLDQYSSAISHLVNNDNFSIDMNELNPDLKILSHIELINQLHGIADAHILLYEEEQKTEYFKKVLNCFMLISELSDQLRQDYQSEESKLFLNESTATFYEKGINAAYKLYTTTKNFSYLNQAFYLSEKSKAALLTEEIKTKEAAGIFTIPPELIDQQYQLRIEINYHKKLIDIETRKRAIPDSIKLKEWNSSLFELIQQREQLRDTIKNQYPNYTKMLKGDIPDLASIQNDLPNKQTAVIEYFIGEKQNFAFFISKNSIELKPLVNEQEISSKVYQVLEERKLNKSNSLETFKQVSHQLYIGLLGSFDLDKINKLIIIPDGPLSYLPFEILLASTPKNNNIKNFDYLIRSKTISYSYSYSLSKLQHNTTQSSGKCLIVSPVFKNIPDKHLQHNNDELKNLTKLKHVELKHNNATVANFLNHAPDCDLLYFSTHATSNDSLSNQPAIEFIDEQLYLSDLYTLNLSAQLAILSACETGIGRQRKGEGVMSLARGFTYAGVPSVMTTLWSVNEKATSTIMQNFHKHLEQGDDKDEALRLAKLEYLDDCPDLKSTPYYWGGFVIIGNTDPFQFGKGGIAWYYIITITLLLGIICFYCLKKNNVSS